jgi:transcriptional regulator with XRE-family HTH domain
MALTGEQVRAARAMARIEQADLAQRAGVSVDTIKRLERTPGPLSANVATVEAVQRALEAAGVEFTNGGQPGVRLRMREDTHSDLKQQINHMQARVDFDEPRGRASPKRGMQQLRGAKSKNELVKLTNRRTRLEHREKK